MFFSLAADRSKGKRLPLVRAMLACREALGSALKDWGDPCTLLLIWRWGRVLLSLKTISRLMLERRAQEVTL
jgi:hypothetical protein